VSKVFHNNNEIILKKVKAVLLPDKVTSSVKTETTRIDYYYIEESYIFPRVWITIWDIRIVLMYYNLSFSEYQK